MASLAQITVRIPKEVKENLALRAEAAGVTLPEYTRELLTWAATRPMAEKVSREEEIPMVAYDATSLSEGNPDTRSMSEKVAALLSRIRGGRGE